MIFEIFKGGFLPVWLIEDDCLYQDQSTAQTGLKSAYEISNTFIIALKILIVVPPAGGTEPENNE
jgi:hypothetical protein